MSEQTDRWIRDQLTLAGRDISHPKVIAAMRRIPRDAFVPDDLKGSAWHDGPLPIGEGQTISQPFIVAYMTEAILNGPVTRVLEIGTGSGYQTAILAETVPEVWTVERIPALAHRARARLESLGYNNISYRIDDGSLGWSRGAPYGAILATCAPGRVPAALLEQLEEGGRLVIPVGRSGKQHLYRYTRQGKDFPRENLLGVRFVPMLQGR